MNILNISPTIFSKESVIGGGEKYLNYCQMALSTAMNKNNRRGNVQIAFPSTSIKYQSNGPQSIVTFYSHNGKPEDFDLDSFKLLVSKYDVVIVHQCLSKFGMRAGALSKLMNKRVIGFDHGGGEDADIFWSHDATYFYDVFIAQSRFAARAFDNFYNRVEIVLGPIPTGMFYPHSTNRRAKNELLSIGRILPHKGFEQIINNMPKNTTLTILGKVYDDGYLNYLKECIESKKANVNFHHSSSDDEVRELIQNSSLYVQASKKIDYKNRFYSKPELLSLASLEALSFGVPTLVSNVGALPELATIPGCFVYNSDAELKQLLENDYSSYHQSYFRNEMKECVEMTYGMDQFGNRILSILDSLDSI